MNVRRNCLIEHLTRFINSFILFTDTNASVSLNYLFSTHGKHYGNKYDLVTVFLVSFLHLFFLCFRTNKHAHCHTHTHTHLYYKANLSLFIWKTNMSKWHWNKAISWCLKVTWTGTINISLYNLTFGQNICSRFVLTTIFFIHNWDTFVDRKQCWLLMLERPIYIKQNKITLKFNKKI